MKRVFLLLTLGLPAMFVVPAAGQDASDVTFEGAVAETISSDPLLIGFAGSQGVGPGFIRITLTPSMDGILRAEIVDVATVIIASDFKFEEETSGERYYWPPLPIEDGRFALTMPLYAHVAGSTPLSYVNIEGEVVSSSELRGTLQHSSTGLVTTTWAATGPADTPPGADDRLFDAFAEGGGRVSVSLAEDGLSVTAFDVDELPLDRCLPGEPLSVRAFFEPGADLDRADVIVDREGIPHAVGLDVAEVDGSHASGTLRVASLEEGIRLVCDLVVSWQTVPFPTATATAQATATQTTTTPQPTPGPDAPGVTFEGEVAQTILPDFSKALGPGFIRVTLTPNMDGVLRAEIADVQRVVPADRKDHFSVETYYWPPLPIEDGRFALSLPIMEIGLFSRNIRMEGEVVSKSELRGTLQHSFFLEPITTWTATGPADTPPSADDRLFDAFIEGGGRVSVALAEDGMSVTTFDLIELPMEPCFPRETLSVRAFFEPGAGIDESEGGSQSAFARVRGEGIRHEVVLDVAEVDGSHASGTLRVISLQSERTVVCDLIVSWQTEPFPTAIAPATAEPTPGQDAPDVTFEGRVGESISTESFVVVGPGSIRITLTPSMDGILHVEIADVRTGALGDAPDFHSSAQRYYWPPLPIEDGRFQLSLGLGPAFGSGPRWAMAVEGEVFSRSRLRGTLQHSRFESVTTPWSATGPADTPPGADDKLFDALIEGGGSVSVALAEDGMSVTSFHLNDLPLDPCFPGETLSVRPIFEPGAGLHEAGVRVSGEDSMEHHVGLDVAEADGSHASGTLRVTSIRSREVVCELVVSWQSEQASTAEATAKPTPILEPTGLPASGGGTVRGVPSAGLAILVAIAGAALAAAGLIGMRNRVI